MRPVLGCRHFSIMRSSWNLLIGNFAGAAAAYIQIQIQIESLHTRLDGLARQTRSVSV